MVGDVRVRIVFGDRWIETDLPEGTKIVKPGFGFGAKLEPAKDQIRVVEDAIREPLDLEPISSARSFWKVTIAFDDPTVPCFAPVWERAILCIAEELKKAGVPKSNVTLLCANALHRSVTASLTGARMQHSLTQTHC